MRVRYIGEPSLVDVPGYASVVVYFAGCNFECPWCHNASLYKVRQESDVISVDDLLDRLSGGYMSACCLTGGEPTVQAEFPDFVKRLYEVGFKHINLSTNGSNPDVVKECLDYVDSVWLDIKADRNNYDRVVGKVNSIWDRVWTTVDVLLDSDVAFWPRTTYVHPLMSCGDLVAIGRTLEKSGFDGVYQIQNYVCSDGVLEENRDRYTKIALEDIQSLLETELSGMKIKFDWR